MRSTRLFVLLGMALCTVGSIAYFRASNVAYLERINREKLPTEPRASNHGTTSSSTTPSTATPSTTTPTTRNYKDALAKLEAERLRLASRFQHASPAERTAVIAEARTTITHSIYEDLFSAWYGTPWDFNGTSETPQQGKIACGYFVSTILRDAGWKVERVRLAQQASEKIILSLTTEPFIKRFRRMPISDFLNAVKQWGPGIYIVGLDIHVGFIVNTDGDVYFVHSSYVDPSKVIKEKAIESPILSSSNYRVLGKVFGDDLLITNWLLGKPIPTRVASTN